MNVILVPVYKPDDGLVNLVNELNTESFPILIVDDGSGEEYKQVFSKVEAQATVVHQPKNMGKGAALKYGMSVMLEHFPECTGIITVDGDGQHKLEDIKKVHAALNQGASMVVTARDLQGNVPARSIFGNRLSRWVYTILAGHYMTDNQSGLRGFAVEHLDWLQRVKGQKYDYEMNVLYFADMQHIKMEMLPIETVYIDDNKSSHFQPTLDTIRIYRQLFLSAIGSLIGGIWFEAGLFISCIMLSGWKELVGCFASGFIACLVSLVIHLVTCSSMKIKYKDGVRLLLNALVRHLGYLLFSFLIHLALPWMSLVIIYNIVIGFAIPVQYNWQRLYAAGSHRR